MECHSRPDRLEEVQEELMEWAKKNMQYIISGIVIPFLMWAGNEILNAQYQKGYNEAKHANDEEFNQALRDAIIYRAKYESCCTAE
jgi:uncharacterized membrane protein (DUF106 family)